MKKLIIIFFVVSVLPLTGFTGDLYRWVDENGVSHVSDYPPPDGNRIVSTRRVEPGKMNAAQPSGKASQELAEMEINFRAQQRWRDKIQLQLQLKLLEAQGKPANSVEADQLRKSFAKDLYYQAMQRTGMEKITILNECIQMQQEIANIGAIYDYKKRP